MAIEQTLSIIKPDAVAGNHIGAIISRFENAGLKVIAARMQQLTSGEAAEFYAVHKDKPFYRELIDFMVSGPVLVMVLEGEQAIARNRELMGATFPKDAVPGTIRADFCDPEGDQGENAVHGSDSAETARREITFFFRPDEICARRR
ncbi:MAG: nucleoside-diphosphate kinase [Gammaproteobacteria bacterium]|jgi:nucleoside-diphosphate kinase